MKKSDFSFDLPESLIAQVPLKDRSQSRLMVVNRQDQSLYDTHFQDIVDYIQPNDVLVRNNTKVIPARLLGTKEVTHAAVELLLLHQEGDVWECLVGNAKVVKVGTIIDFGDGQLKAECVGLGDQGIRYFKMHYQGVFMELLDELGQMPLPPYIKTQLKDNNRYQTVYAKIEGSAAAPTAGLHFTPEIFSKLSQKGVKIVDITLHVGLGTFKPMKVENVTDHHMHAEYYQVSAEAAEILNQTRANGGKIIAVGTTSTRTLETIYQKHGKFVADQGMTDIFIYPGIKMEAIDALITNFHLPESTLLLLVSAFSSLELMKKAYQHAIDEKYRFFSFGDAMLII